MLNHKIRSRAIWNKWALNRILTETALDEQTIELAGAISQKIDEHLSHERIKKLTEKQSETPTNQNKSGRYGNSRTHTICPAIGVSCDKCGKKNHYARVSFGKAKQQPKNGNRRFRHRRGRNNTDPKDFRDQRDKRDFSASGKNKSQRNLTRHTGQVGYQSSGDSSSDDERFICHLKAHYTSQNNSQH